MRNSWCLVCSANIPNHVDVITVPMYVTLGWFIIKWYTEAIFAKKKKLKKTRRNRTRPVIMVTKRDQIARIRKMSIFPLWSTLFVDVRSTTYHRTVRGGSKNHSLNCGDIDWPVSVMHGRQIVLGKSNTKKSITNFGKSSERKISLTILLDQRVSWLNGIYGDFVPPFRLHTANCS